MKKDMSPEERLLALIKNKDKKTGEPAAENQAAKTPPTLQTESTKKYVHLSNTFRAYLSKINIFEPAVLKSINKYLVIMSVLLTVYFIADLLFVKPYRNVMPAIQAMPEPRKNALQAKKETPLEVKDYSQYSQAISGKNIFGQPAGGESGPSREINVLEDASNNIGLVGIVAGTNPLAIIEDKKNQKTYYLSRGESFNGYTVEEILEDRVILGCEGKTITLFL